MPIYGSLVSLLDFWRRYCHKGYVTISHMNFSPITDDLFIGTTSSTEDYNYLRELGVRLVINMRVESII